MRPEHHVGEPGDYLQVVRYHPRGYCWRQEPCSSITNNGTGSFTINFKQVGYSLCGASITPWPAWAPRPSRAGYQGVQFFRQDLQRPTPKGRRQWLFRLTPTFILVTSLSSETPLVSKGESSDFKVAAPGKPGGCQDVRRLAQRQGQGRGARSRRRVRRAL